ncbi:MAG: PIN domain-containing protein [Thermodesulfovibrionales bacterium]|nr:PIN domain-containing protein [Thermodesulfovibrionales bacterium]
MIIIDTGPLVALFDKSDNRHDLCHAILRTTKMSLITTIPVLTEAFYILSFSWHIQDDLWKFITDDNLGIYNLDRNLLKICRELMNKYQDLPMDFADASLVVVAERENISTVFTLDHKDFKVYRTKHGKGFKLLPSSLES